MEDYISEPCLMTNHFSCIEVNCSCGCHEEDEEEENDG